MSRVYVPYFSVLFAVALYSTPYGKYVYPAVDADQRTEPSRSTAAALPSALIRLPAKYTLRLWKVKLTWVPVIPAMV